MTKLRRWPGLALLLAVSAPARFARSPSAVASGTVVLLVRHAETQEDGTSDPVLSDSGRSRALGLVDALASVRLTGVHSMSYKRTRETAAPAAAAHGLGVQEYDPQQLATFVTRLTESGGTHLVVGHSNTTPALVRALGGDAGAPIAEGEHDRLYLLVIDASDVDTVLLHLPFR